MAELNIAIADDNRQTLEMLGEYWRVKKIIMSLERRIMVMKHTI